MKNETPNYFSLYYLLKFNLVRIIFLIPWMKILAFCFPFLHSKYCSRGLPKCHSGKESIFQCRRCKRCQFHCLVGKIPWCMITPLHILTWKIPWTKNPGEIQSMGPQRVGHNGAIEHYSSTSSLKVANTWKCPILHVNFNQKLESGIKSSPLLQLEGWQIKVTVKI